MNKCIVTYAAGEHCKLLEIALPTFKRFADKHGYDFLVGDKQCDRPPAWNKIPLLATALKAYESVLWFDADLVIVDDSEDIPAVPPEYSHAMVRHFESGSEVPNSGMWFLRPACLPLLESLWSLEVFMNHGWWEQAALLTLMGYTVPPEGSDFRKTKCRCVWPTTWRDKVQFLPLEWNAHPNCRGEVSRIVHCSYKDMEQRIEVMRELVNNPGYNYPERKTEEKSDSHEDETQS